VKDYFFYLDNLPSHAYMRMLYKYPHAAFPYADLVHGNRERGRLDPAYQLIDTGVFAEDRYCDVFVEYAKESPEEICIRLTLENRGPEAARLHVLPQLWFRNTWWRDPRASRPLIEQSPSHLAGTLVLVARDPELGACFLKCERAGELLFTDNETNTELLLGQPNTSPFVKDAINEYLVRGQRAALDPRGQGTKAAAHYVVTVPARGQHVIRLRFGTSAASSFDTFDATFEERKCEADEFYAAMIPRGLKGDAALVIRQAYAGMLWSKQAYHYDVRTWLDDRRGARGEGARSIRNRDWFHMVASDVIAVPDKWQQPWFSSWELAFHTVALAFVDPDFAANQLDLLLCERYAHPNGQIPASEWNFGDVNPPVHAWAALFVYRLQRARHSDRALRTLQRAFHKLLLNFTWWMNRKDATGRSVFDGGFVGLDNLGVFDHNAPLPAGGCLEQADGTGWMALFAQNMLDMALELALHDRNYEELAMKFYEHFIWIAAAMDRVGEHSDEMWDEGDGFFYDVLRFPAGSGTRLKVRSMAGLIPLCANTVYPEEVLRRLPRFVERVRWYNRERRDLLQNINHPDQGGVRGRRLLSVLDERKLRLVLKRMLDPAEFLSDYGIRSLSRVHRAHPYVFRSGMDEYQVAYRPSGSDPGLFGGNSNWRGPVWLPVNVLIVRALLQLYSFHGDAFRVECPTGSGKFLTLFEVGMDIVQRLASLFMRNDDGRRPLHGAVRRFQDDPHWRDLILFYEYFNGDDGAGLGASHKTGWTALIAPLLLLGDLSAEDASRDIGRIFQRIANRWR
jgi:hypothetical protein